MPEEANFFCRLLNVHLSTVTSDAATLRAVSVVVAAVQVSPSVAVASPPVAAARHSHLWFAQLRDPPQTMPALWTALTAAR